MLLPEALEAGDVICCHLNGCMCAAKLCNVVGLDD